MNYYKNYFLKYSKLLSDIDLSNFKKFENLLKSFKNKKKKFLYLEMVEAHQYLLM